VPGSYLRLERSWLAGDRIVLELPMEVRIAVADGRMDAGWPYRRCGADSPVTPARLTAIPYHAWADRGVSAMRMWVPPAGASGD
jgi:hypothetical protein